MNIKKLCDELEAEAVEWEKSSQKGMAAGLRAAIAIAYNHGGEAEDQTLQPRVGYSTTLTRFRDALVKHGIVRRGAIEDAEFYDGGRTLAATQAACDELIANEELTLRNAAKRNGGSVQ